MQNQEAALKSLENQVGQISQVLKSRPFGGFPSDTEVAKGVIHEQCKAMSTRSGKVLKTPTKNKQGETTIANSKVVEDTDNPAPVEENHNTPSEPEEAEITTATPQTKQPREDTPEEPRPASPFPERLKKQKQEYQYKKFFDILKQVHINLPLVEALQHMPNYAKFYKDMVSRKTRIGEFETDAAIEACLAMMHNKVSAKNTDLEALSYHAPLGTTTQPKPCVILVQASICCPNLSSRSLALEKPS
ncbi:hypothetical protein V6N13_008321 [Hibiscus sabdariffa]